MDDAYVDRHALTLAGRMIRPKLGQQKLQGFGRCARSIGREDNPSQRRRLALDDKHRAGRMMNEFRRDAAEHEAVEGVEALTAHHQKPGLFRCAFQDCWSNRSLFLTGGPFEFQRSKLLCSLLQGFDCTRFHALNFFLNVPLRTGHHRPREKRRTERGNIKYMQRSYLWRLDKRQHSRPVQGPSSVLRSIHCHKHIHVPFLSFAQAIHEYLLHRPILSFCGTVLVRPPRQIASTYKFWGYAKASATAYLGRPVFALSSNDKHGTVHVLHYPR